MAKIIHIWLILLVKVIQNRSWQKGVNKLYILGLPPSQ